MALPYLTDFDPKSTCPCAPNDATLHPKLNKPWEPMFEFTSIQASLLKQKKFKPIRTPEETAQYNANNDSSSFTNQLWPFEVKRIGKLDDLQRGLMTDRVQLEHISKKMKPALATLVQVPCVHAPLLQLLIWVFDMISECIFISQDYNMSTHLDHQAADRRLNNMIDQITIKSSQIRTRAYEQDAMPDVMEIWLNVMHRSLFEFDPAHAIEFAEQITFDPDNAAKLLFKIKAQQHTAIELEEFESMMRRYLSASHLEIVPACLRMSPNRIDDFYPDRHLQIMNMNRLLRIWSWMCHYANQLSFLINESQSNYRSLPESIEIMFGSKEAWVPNVVAMVRAYTNMPTLQAKPIMTFHRRVPCLMILYEPLVSLREWFVFSVGAIKNHEDRAVAVVNVMCQLYRVVRDVRLKSRFVAKRALQWDDFAIRVTVKNPSLSSIANNNLDILVMDLNTRYTNTTLITSPIIVPNNIALGLVRLMIDMIRMADIDLITIQSDAMASLFDVLLTLRDIDNDTYPWMFDHGIVEMVDLQNRLDQWYDTMRNLPNLVGNPNITVRRSRRLNPSQ